MLCSRNFLVSKKFVEKRGGGEPRFSAKIYLSHRAEKSRRGTLLCLTEFPVSKKFMEKKGEYQDLPSVVFWLTVQKNVVGEHFFVSQNFRYRKMSGIREGVIHIFPSENFVSHCRKHS